LTLAKIKPHVLADYLLGSRFFFGNWLDEQLLVGGESIFATSKSFEKQMDIINWLNTYLEDITAVFNLLFVILLIRESIWCWFFGIVGSLLAVVLFLTPDVKLYSEALLYFVYVVLGVYGWFTWSRRGLTERMPIVRWSAMSHVIAIATSCGIWYLMGQWMKNNTDASMPWADAFSTSFSLVATWLETQKVLSGWIYWIGLNSFSIWLYTQRGLKSMALLMLIFAILSIVGYVRWRKEYKIQQENI